MSKINLFWPAAGHPHTKKKHSPKGEYFFKGYLNFHPYFKKITGQTPTEYMRNLAGVV
ncbi:MULTISPECIES: hypothetical protein [unclassified Chitinophaga]|uniref:hypothetical protein n=1 Tax=unclassified Chitinophaga TaxID=2619133 RepID=UPI0015C367DC|nr:MULTISPECIES: hypothetical protein [unclassified Chitinophaga]WPV65783.1 hypothetical protein QQL36_28690 [Chitinophaga sp. LS1]